MKYKTEIKLVLIVLGAFCLLLGLGLIFSNFESLETYALDCRLGYASNCENFNLDEAIYDQKVKGVFFGFGGIALIVGGLLIGLWGNNL